eukprot:440921_1
MDQSHPEDSPSVCFRIINFIVPFWVINLIKLKDVQHYDIKSVPKSLKPESTFNKWKSSEIVGKNSTLSMIYLTQKILIFKSIILCISIAIVTSLVYYIFITKIYGTFQSINTENFDVLIPYIAFYAFVIFLLMTTKSILGRHVFDTAHRIRMQTISNLYMAIYERTLSVDLDDSDKQHILNIIGSDINDIYTGLWFLMGYGTTVIIVLIVAICCLYIVLGPSALFGYLFMIFFGIPFQLFGGYKLSQHIKLKNEFSDKRVEIITQLVRGIRVLKYSCHELPLMHKINECRKQETIHIKSRNFYFGLLILSNFMIPA